LGQYGLGLPVAVINGNMLDSTGEYEIFKKPSSYPKPTVGVGYHFFLMVTILSSCIFASFAWLTGSLSLCPLFKGVY